MDTADGNYIRGLRDLLRQLKDQRNQRLERYDMGSVMEDIKRQLEEIRTLHELCTDVRFNHRLTVFEGVLAEECGAVLSEFFQRLRRGTE